MERTLVLVKPDAMERNLGGAILARVEAAGLKIVALRVLRVDEALAHKHYAVHAGKSFFKDLIESHKNILWSHPMFPTSDSKDVEELTRVDIDARSRIVKTYEFLKKNMPGFENSVIMLTSPQLGTQGGRRLIGEYMLTEKDMETDEVFEDTIAIFPNNDNGEISANHPVMCIPYRTMVPKTPVENLLVACRAYSTADSINHQFNIIPFCLCLGQAAGTAAALALEADTTVRQVDYGVLKGNLKKQGVILPG